jgi:hypothetical protein
MSMKNPNDPTGTGTRNLPACSAVVSPNVCNGNKDGKKGKHLQDHRLS